MLVPPSAIRTLFCSSTRQLDPDMAVTFPEKLTVVPLESGCAVEKTDSVPLGQEGTLLPVASPWVVNIFCRNKIVNPKIPTVAINKIIEIIIFLSIGCFPPAEGGGLRGGGGAIGGCWGGGGGTVIDGSAILGADGTVTDTDGVLADG